MDREKTATRLLRSSASNTYDPEVEIDWDAPFVDGLYFCPPERCSLYGTDLWDGLTEDQRIELSKHEVASVAGLGVWFETILMQMLLREYFRQDPTDRHAQYALTEVGDECRHSVMFGRMIERFGAPHYRPAGRDDLLGKYVASTATGPRMYAATLIAEEVLDTFQREAMADERVQPLVRMVSRIHVIEESRHVRYAREELARQIEQASKPRLAFDRLIIARTAWLTGHHLVHQDVYRSVGIEPAVGRRAAWTNPHFQETLRWAGERVVEFLDGLGLIDGPGKALWKRSGLLQEVAG
ncbi:diiron oxygenase [Actinoplanes sp. NPDC051470]|uniref:AurF N-oxygenase family protein n=1 Tax=unclassified Actinoplanes TaxID=2626549 RepID=UPI00342B3A23